MTREQLDRLLHETLWAEEAAFAVAERLRAKILKRTGLKAEELACPREQSSMTPCVARDGKLAVGVGTGGKALCVGCEWGVVTLLQKELTKTV